jgi:hypothetical protein
MNFQTFSQLLLATLLPLQLMHAKDKEDYIPKAGEFPPHDVGHYFSGELISIDHINRRGAIRLVGNNASDRYHRAPSLLYAMLPYGYIRYHGAPAQLRDIPIGTVVHGYFVLPRESDETLPPFQPKERYSYKYTNALTLEDDFSFYQRRTQSWQLEEIKLQYTSSDFKNIDWRNTPLYSGTLKATLKGEQTEDGLTGNMVFSVDRSTRIWKGNQKINWEDLAGEEDWTFDQTRNLILKDTLAQLNLTWAPDWENQKFHVTDIWLDEQSRKIAADTQRQRHIRFMRHRWLPGWIDHVEHKTGGSGVVTLTLFDGNDASLYAEVLQTAKSHGGVSIASGEWTLRTWWQDHDKKAGRITNFKEIQDPPFGHSGIQLKIEFQELLAGFAPGRIIRLRTNYFPNVKLPPEERVKSMEERVPPPYKPH